MAGTEILTFFSCVLSDFFFTSYSAMRSQAHDWKFLGFLLINTDQKDNLPVWSFFIFFLEQFLKVACSSDVHPLSKCVFFWSLFLSYVFLLLLPFILVLGLYSFGLFPLGLRRDTPEFECSWLLELTWKFSLQLPCKQRAQ